MRKIMTPLLLAAALTTPALAQSYPVSGKWGESTSSQKGPIDCSGRRVMQFEGNQRTDSDGGVPSYRNLSVTSAGSSRYRVVDTFANALQSNPHTEYTLTQVDQDHIVLDTQGGPIRLQRCR